jgi:hypothetical protein
LEESEQGAQAERVSWEEVKGEEWVGLRVDSALDLMMILELPFVDRTPFVEGPSLFLQQFL